MKIVIDIDNETYGRIQALVNADYFEHDICGYSMQRIANGTPYEERPQGEWIPVSERLPDIAKKCIVQLTDGHITIGSYHSIDKWTFQETSVRYSYPKESVIAWQPLPELYKKEEENV